MGFLSLVLPSSGGGITEYDALADLPSNPTDGDQAVVGGLLLVASGGVWVYQTPPPISAPAAPAAPSTVANALPVPAAFPTFTSDPIDAPATDSAWTGIP